MKYLSKDMEQELTDKIKLIIWEAEHQRYPETSVPFDHHGTIDDRSWDKERERITLIAKRIVQTGFLQTEEIDIDKVFYKYIRTYFGKETADQLYSKPLFSLFLEEGK